MFEKKCGHLDEKILISRDDMVKKIRSCVKARYDSNFLIIARTDARHVEGMDAMLDRAKAYVDAGADMIFVEALEGQSEFLLARKQINTFLLANLTEFGKTPLLHYSILEKMGYNLLIYPLTVQRLAMKAIQKGLQHLKQHGDQRELLHSMQTRQELYDLLEYANITHEEDEDE